LVLKHRRLFDIQMEEEEKREFWKGETDRAHTVRSMGHKTSKSQEYFWNEKYRHNLNPE